MTKEKARAHFRKMADTHDDGIRHKDIQHHNTVFCPRCGRVKWMYHIRIGISNYVEYNWYCSKCGDAFVIASESGVI